MENKENKSAIPENSRQTIFEKKIAPTLNYIGAIGAVLMTIAYIVVVMVLIVGFKVQSFTQTFVFALVNGVVGLIICQFLKIQGIAFAKQLPENKDVITRYYANKTNDKKFRSIKSYWKRSLVQDICLKGTAIVVSSAGLIYIVIQGSNDYNLLLLAIVNLIMFACFGLLGLVNAYETYNTEHVPYMINELEEASKPKPELKKIPVSTTEMLLALENLKDKEILCSQTETEPHGEI